MGDTSNALEGLKLISDWAKWLITIEAGAIAIIGGAVKEKVATPWIVKLFATAAVVSFVISIAAAALLLLTLPEIAQNLRPETNIWLTEDSIMGWLLGMNTQSLAIGESFFFGLGVICFAGLIVGATWSQAPCSKT